MIIGKIAQKLDCESQLSHRSKKFMSLNPVNMDGHQIGRGLISLGKQTPDQNITQKNADFLTLHGEKKTLENKKLSPLA